MKISGIAKGDKMISRDEKNTGIFTGVTRPYNLEGCRGLRHTVKWNDGKISYPCGKGLRYDFKMKCWAFIN